MKPFDREKTNKLFLIGLIGYLALGILALLFWKERTIFLDIAFHLFYILEDGTYAIQNLRFGAGITQTFPLLAYKLNAPLNWVMITYSIAFIIYYSGIYIICFNVLKNYKAGIVMLLFSTLMVADTFFWIQSELPQGIAFTILFFGLITRKEDLRYFKWYELTAGALMILVIAFFHPLMFIIFTFITLFFLIKKNVADRRILIASFGLLIAILFLKNILIETPAYESQAYGGLGNFKALFPDYFTIQANKDFLRYLILDYYYLAILLPVLGIYFFWRKLYLELILVFSFFFGYLLLINVSYYYGADKFYLENLYLPLSLFVIFPFVYDLLFKELSFQWAMIVLVLIVSTRVGYIYFTHDKYSERLAWYNDFLEETSAIGKDKLIVSDELVPKETLFMTWASSYEIWLLSTIKEGKSRSIIINDNLDEFNWALENNKGFLTKWGIYDHEELPERYFKFTDTSYYQKVNKEAYWK